VSARQLLLHRSAGSGRGDLTLIAQMIGWQKQIVIHPAPHLN